MTICIQYNRPASGKSDNEIFGFDVAVTNFMLAYFRHGKAVSFVCRPGDSASFDHFKELAAQAGVDAERRCVGLDPRHPQTNLQSISCLFRPDPLTVDLMWRRRQMRGRGYATCGLVHTMSGERIAAAVNDMCLAPSDGTDALICPSVSIRNAVRALWEIYGDYLNHRFGGRFTCPVQTPVIPLGIDTGRFERLSSQDKRAAQRAALGLAEDEIAVLFVGRLSFATKAHPLPLFLALNEAARLSGRKIHLLMYGYFKPKDMEPHFRDLARDFCRGYQIQFIANDDPRFPDGLWAAGDIFTSFSDNVQESFGLTPIEAMACGLPSVISDWDGYREGLRQSVDGYRVPTSTPPARAGMDLADYYYNEGNYGVALSASAQSTGVDVTYATHAFTALIGNDALRRQMGDAARERAQSVFDWRHVIPAYEQLWADLSEKRSRDAVPSGVPENWEASHPGYPNPWRMFADFPTAQMDMLDSLRIAMDAQDTENVLRHEMNFFVPDLLIPKEQMRQLIGVIRHAGRVRIQDILAPYPAEHQNRLLRCLGWMVKHGVCALERHE